MHTMLNRLNAVSALATSVLLGLLACVALSSFGIPAELEPASLKVNNLNVVLGKSPGNRKEQEFAFARFDIKAGARLSGLEPLWNWNTKQVFLQFISHYETPEYPDNQIVLWDRIVRRKRDSKINVEDLRNKYAFKEIGERGFRGLNATFALHYNIMPHVGILRYGEAGRTESIPFPPVQNIVR